MTVAYSRIPTRPSSLDAAFDYCAKITEAHYENFPVASLFLPSEKRPYIQAIYAFSRIADDFADELDRQPADRLDALNDWENKLRLCKLGEADHPVFVALQEVIRKLDLPLDPFVDLISAFKQDVNVNRYTSFDDLIGYCRCSANPVGRLVLMVFGYHDPKLFALSDHLCTALQLTNFWQDVGMDLHKDRLYLPVDDMRQFGYSEEKWKNRLADRSFEKLMEYEIQRTKEMFYLGASLPSLVERDLQLELKLVWFGGMAILKKLKAIRYDVLHQRPTLNAANKFMVLCRGIAVDRLTRYGRKGELWEQT